MREESTMTNRHKRVGDAQRQKNERVRSIKRVRAADAEKPKQSKPRIRAKQQEVVPVDRSKTPFPFARITPRTREEYDREIVSRAQYWTAFRRKGRFEHQQTKHATYEEARKQGTGDGSTMIYAVDAHGNSSWVENV